MIFRNIAKELCNKYQRPENCQALVVAKINKEYNIVDKKYKGPGQDISNSSKVHQPSTYPTCAVD